MLIYSFHKGVYFSGSHMCLFSGHERHVQHASQTFPLTHKGARYWLPGRPAGPDQAVGWPSGPLGVLIGKCVLCFLWAGIQGKRNWRLRFCLKLSLQGDGLCRQFLPAPPFSWGLSLGPLLYPAGPHRAAEARITCPVSPWETHWIYTLRWYPVSFVYEGLF